MDHPVEIFTIKNADPFFLVGDLIVVFLNEREKQKWQR